MVPEVLPLDLQLDAALVEGIVDLPSLSILGVCIDALVGRDTPFDFELGLAVLIVGVYVVIVKTSVVC